MWLEHFLRHQAKALDAAGTGSTFRQIDKDTLTNWPLDLPPLNEQRRIVAKIEALMGRSGRAKEALDAIPALLDRYRQSVLAAAFRGDLTAEWREQHPDIGAFSDAASKWLKHKGPRKTRRGVPAEVSISDAVASWQLPSSWSRMSVGKLLHCGALIDVKDGNHGELHPKASDFSDTGTPFITAAQVRFGRIDYETAPKIEGLPLEKLKIGFAEVGDVVLTHKGTIGRVAINDRSCILTPQTTYYRVQGALIRAKFLRYFMESRQFYDQLAAVMSQTTRNFVPITEQYRVFLAIPPTEEQEIIEQALEGALDHVDSLRSSVDVASNRLPILSQSILAKAFRGELVPQDPNDEPASALAAGIPTRRTRLRKRDRPHVMP